MAQAINPSVVAQANWAFFVSDLERPTMIV